MLPVAQATASTQYNNTRYFLIIEQKTPSGHPNINIKHTPTITADQMNLANLSLFPHWRTSNAGGDGLAKRVP